MRKTYLLVLSVLIFSALVTASSIPADPTGGLRPGTDYWVTPFNITGPIIPPFQPFSASFCEPSGDFSFDGVTYNGPDCIFNNRSDLTIASLDLAFTTQVGAIHCFNILGGGETIDDACNPFPNLIMFTGLGVPPQDGYEWEGSEFNIVFAAKRINGVLTDAWDPNTVAAAGLNGTPPPPLPEPASAYLVLGGISCLFGLMRKKRHLKT